jgi:hypothetical protein
MKHNGTLNTFIMMTAAWSLVLFLGAVFVADDFNVWGRLASSIIVGLLLGWVTWRFTRADA